MTVKDPPDAAGLPAIVHRSPVPIVADIHFDHKMALAAIEAGVAKLRLNPGNIRDPKKVAEVVDRGQGARDSDSRRRQHGLARAGLGEDARAYGRGDGAFGAAPRRDARGARAHRHRDLAQGPRRCDDRRGVSPGRPAAARARNALRAAPRHHRGRLAARRHDQVVDRPGHSALGGHRRHDSRFAGGRSDRRGAGLLGHPQVARPARERLRDYGLPVVRPRRDLGARARPRGRSDREVVSARR